MAMMGPRQSGQVAVTAAPAQRGMQARQNVCQQELMADSMARVLPTGLNISGAAGSVPRCHIVLPTASRAAAMEPLSLSQLLDLSFATPDPAAVNFTVLRRLLQALLRQLGLLDLPAPERGHGPSPLLVGGQPAEAQPGLERRGDTAQGTGQQPREPGEQLPRKEPLLQGTVSSPQVASLAAALGQLQQQVEANESGIAKVEALAGALGQLQQRVEANESGIAKVEALAGGLGQLQQRVEANESGIAKVEALAGGLGQLQQRVEANESGIAKDLLEEMGGVRAAQSRMAEDICTIQVALGLGTLQDAAGRLPGLHDQATLGSDAQGSGGQAALAECPRSDVDIPRGTSSGPAPMGPGTWPAPRTGTGSPGTQAGTLGGQEGTPEKRAGAPSDRRGTSDGSTTAPGVQPGAPVSQTPTPGVQPGAPVSQTPTPGVQPGAPGSQTPSPGVQPGAPGSQTPSPVVQPGAPGSQTSTLQVQPGAPVSQTPTPGVQPGAPGSQTPTLGVQPGAPVSQTPTLGVQPGAPGSQTPSPGVQPGAPGSQTPTPGVQPGAPVNQTPTPGVQPGAPGSQTPSPGMQPGAPGSQTPSPGMQPGAPGSQSTALGMQPGSPISQTRTPGMQPGTETTTLGVRPESPGSQTTAPGVQPGAPGSQSTALGMQQGSPISQTRTPGMQPGTETTTLGVRPGSPGSQTTTLGLQPGTPSTETTAPAMQAVSPGSQEGGGGFLPRTPSRGSSRASSDSVETVEALHQIGQLSHLCATLKEQVAQLEAKKSDRGELEQLRLLFPEGDQESIASVLAKLQGRVSSLQGRVSSLQGLASELQGLASELQGEKEKTRQLEDALAKLGVAGAERRADGSDQLSLRLGSMLQEVKRELGQQQEVAKATLEQLVTKTARQLQEQLDELRAMVGSAGQEQAGEWAGVQAACPTCSGDSGARVAKLLRRYEELQELVESVLRQAMGKAARQLPGRRQKQDEERLRRIQASIVQVQEHCEQLSSITGNLQDDRQKQQRDIEALFRSLERLQEEKADKEELLLGIDVKADKAALNGKVSRSQFEASMERLQELIQEVQSRVMGQEQGWQQVQHQLWEELGSKLDRLELGPFRQQLDERWKSALAQLKEKLLLTEVDDAAGMKKQLLPDYQCLSCDRPLRVQTPGPHIVAMPALPPLTPHLAEHPWPVVELEQPQQPGHREQAAERVYPRVPRQCGGQHTLTAPLQHAPRLQPRPPGTPRLLQPLTMLPSKHDQTQLLGRDGHVYQGRRDEQLPPPAGQDGPAAPPQHRPRSCDGRLRRAPRLLPPLRPPRDGAGAPAAGRGWESPAEDPPARPPSRRESGPGQR
ncbi:glutamine-rich protein 2-like [Nyctibius grandis]|uniref:glutamine-rich protein 2-like n=1 Tax=Nyctibius grandis TaxID=48427 RepID=UPI0035BC4B04